MVCFMQDNPASVQTCAAYASRYVQSAYAWDNIIKNEYIPFYENLKEKRSGMNENL